MEQDIWQYYQQRSSGQVQLLGADIYDGTSSQLQSFKSSTGATYPLLLNAATSAGGNLSTLYGPWDNYVVINAQGIVRYHAALTWPHGNRYHLNEIRGCVDSLTTVTAGVGIPSGSREFTLAASPNPFRGGVRVELAHPLAAGARARVTVLDLAGRTVATLWDRAVTEGVVRTTWDGRLDGGGAAPAGVYLIRAEVGGVRLSRRIAFLR